MVNGSRVSAFAKRAISLAITIGLWLLFGVRWVLEVIGYINLPVDTQAAKTQLGKFFDYLLQVPPWVLLIFCLLATIISVISLWLKGQSNEELENEREFVLRISISPSGHPELLEASEDLRFYLHALEIRDPMSKVRRRLETLLFVAFGEPTNTENIVIKLIGGPPVNWRIIDRSQYSLLVDLTAEFSAQELNVSSKPAAA